MLFEKFSKRPSNHGAMKMAVNVERQSIIQVNGHRNEKSLDNCNGGKKINEKDHRELSHIISRTQQHQTVS